MEEKIAAPGNECDELSRPLAAAREGEMSCEEPSQLVAKEPPRGVATLSGPFAREWL